MNKQTFLAQLRKGMSALSEAEREERLLFYSEMIDDRIEEGLSEEEAILGIGSVDSLLGQILGDAPTAPKKHTGRLWNTILLILGAPVWFSLLVSVFAVAISLYISLWSVIISLWAAFGALAGCALGGILAGTVLLVSSKTLSGIALLSGGIVCAGLAIFLFWGCKSATKGAVLLTKKILLKIKNHFISRRVRHG